MLSAKKMAKHFFRTITADDFIFARNDATIAGEAQFHGVYVLRTLVPTTHSIPKPRYAPMRPSPPSNALFAAARPSISRCASSTIGARIGSAPTSSGSCSPRLPPRMAPAPGTRPTLFNDHDRAAAQTQRRSPVAKTTVSPAAQRKAAGKRTDDRHPVHSFRTLLTDLATLTRNTVRFGTDLHATVLTTPTSLQKHAFDLPAVSPTAELES